MNPMKPAVLRPWLVAHDFSSAADAAADMALADLLQMRTPPPLVLLHVYSLPLPPPMPAPFIPLVSNADVAERAFERQAIQDVAERLRGTWLEETGGERPVHIEVVLGAGFAAEAILSEAARLNASRIFVGTHGHTGLSHVLLGSVAERVVRLAKVPVTVIHAPAAEKAKAA